MKATQKLRDLGQSLWLDNITLEVLDRGTLGRYIAELSVTGLTSHPAIFEQKRSWPNIAAFMPEPRFRTTIDRLARQYQRAT